MSTREENLKKINAELAQLSDEELEKVAGGFYARYIGGDGEKKTDVNNDNPSRKIIHVR